MKDFSVVWVDISLENFQMKIYYDISETKLKTRCWNHKKPFSHEKHKNDTQLSNELWYELYMLNKQTEIISKCKYRNKYALASLITWIETSDVKLKFLRIIEIFEVCGSLIYCSCEAGWQKLHLFQISINFKSRCISCDGYSTHVFNIMHVDIFHRVKGIF